MAGGKWYTDDTHRAEKSHRGFPYMNNPDATPRTKALYSMIRSLSGEKILLGQQESPRTILADREIDWIYAVTGEMPAIRGMDFIHDDFPGVVERAKAWNGKGGIVTVCWHTGVDGNDYMASKEENPDWEKLLAPGTKENGQLLRRWEDAAKALLKLQEADIPVLWRPFHEFDGQWFWWGRGGGEPFRALWRAMYRRFTDEYGLNNLIWVLGYADDVRDGWDPGAEYYDIAGSDTYRGETTHAAAFRKLREFVPDKPLALHECGLIPPPEAFFADGCPWSWLMPWHGRWLMDNHPDRIREAYQNERMLPLSRLEAF